METRLKIQYEADIVTARQTIKGVAREMGYSLVDQVRLATAISELTRNAILYAGSGAITIIPMNRNGRDGIQIEVIDEGPGIGDIELAMTDGYTTSGGLGSGLPGSKRLMDEFEIYSEKGKGTRIVIRKWKH